MMLLLYAFCGLYAAGILLCLIGSYRLSIPVGSNRSPRISVVVAARNEEERLRDCLDALTLQEYPAGLLEIIVVNDRSTDATSAIINEFSGRYPYLRPVSIERNDSGMANKKNALAEGIAVSSGEILMFTDADCIVPPGWVAGMAARFTPDTGAVAGYSYLDDGRPGALRRMTALLAHGLELVNAGIIGLGGAFSCTGRSFAYRRTAYDEVGGFSLIGHSVSGDDDLMLQLIRRHTRWRLGYAGEPAVHVRSLPPSGMKELAGQRTRHMSAARWYPLPYRLAGAGMFLFALSLALAPLAVVCGMAPGPAVALVWCVKFGVEMPVLFRAGHLFGRRLPLGWAPVLSIVWVPYFIIFPLRALFGTFTWKNG